MYVMETTFHKVHNRNMLVLDDGVQLLWRQKLQGGLCQYLTADLLGNKNQSLDRELSV